MKTVCLTHDMLQLVIDSGAVIYHISNVNEVLQYTRITALYNTSVIFLAVQNNYLQGHIIFMLVADFEIIITKPFPAALILHRSDFMATYLNLFILRRRVAPWSNASKITLIVYEMRESMVRDGVGPILSSKFRAASVWG